MTFRLRILAILSRIHSKHWRSSTQETESALARADQATLLTTVDEYARLVNSVRVSIMDRFYLMLRTLTCLFITDGVQFVCASVPRTKNVDADLRRVKQAHERNRAQGEVAVENEIVSDIHILKLARCVFLPSMLVTAVHIQETVPL